MKKVLALFALFAIVALAGCQQAATTTEPTVPEASIASSIGYLAKYSVAVDNAVMGVVGISSISAAEVCICAPSTPALGTDNWWTSTDSYSAGGYTYTITYRFKLWNSSGTLINTQALLDALTEDTLDKVWMWVDYSIVYGGASFSMSLGSSKDNPLKFEGLVVPPKTVDGPISYSGTSDDTSYSVTVTYSSLSLSASGYPSGEVGVSVSEGDTAVVEATITFNGTSTATITFTSGYSGTYTVDLDTGLVTASSL